MEPVGSLLCPQACVFLAEFRWYIFFFKFAEWGVGVQTGSTRHVGHLLAYCTCPGWLWGWRIWWNELAGETEVLGENLPRLHFPTNPTWPDPGSNPGRRAGKSATNRLSYGAAQVIIVPTNIQPNTWTRVLGSCCGRTTVWAANGSATMTCFLE
jgi:hypothetical protein